LFKSDASSSEVPGSNLWLRIEDPKDFLIFHGFSKLIRDISLKEAEIGSTTSIEKLAFAIRVFAYPRFYFSIMRIISILSAATFEAAAQAH
jgi:hypothetical protein